MPRTVLIVDDSPTIRGFARLFLKALPVEVAEAEEGRQALEIVRRSVPLVAIVDVNMPGMDGLSFTRELRADARPEVANLPVVLLTGEAGAEIEQQGRAAGASGFLGKPLKGPDLQALVKRYLGVGA
ncbi:MAG TPA: response regulator [Myxococcales bacterium]|nr:response regulator [Myxococcales bacterium]